jgi:hypothetical protein
MIASDRTNPWNVIPNFFVLSCDCNEAARIISNDNVVTHRVIVAFLAVLDTGLSEGFEGAGFEDHAT